MKKKKLIILVSIAVVAIVAIMIIVSGSKRRAANTVNISEVTAAKMDIVSSIKGTATILPKDSYSINSLINGDVISADFEEGDFVEKGQLLYRLDSKDVEKNISSADVALQQSQLSYSDALKTKNDLYVKSDVSGIIRAIYVKKGDMVAAGTKIADVYDDRNLELTIPFNQSDIGNIYIGSQAKIKLNGSNEILYGTVSSINNASYVKPGNMLVQDVKINVANPGTVSVADTATAEIDAIACNDMGSFKYSIEKSIFAKTTGEVEVINIDSGNFVKAGQTFVTLKNDSIDTAIKNHSLALENAQISRSKAVDALDNYVITAPISGTVVSKNIKAGDKIEITNMSSPMAIIYDMSLLKFILNVDELDINRVANGQEVTISADALEGRKYTGYISNISISANVQNGITTYPVTVEITDFDDYLLPGMNVDVEILIGKAENVLAVPVNSVMRGNTVFVKGEKTDSEDRAPNGFRTVSVETGAYNQDYIEIVSGLSEGDIIYSNLSTGSILEDMSKMMGGGPPSGGGQSGGGHPGGRN